MSWYYSSSGLDPETIIWRDGAIAASGTFESDSISIADGLIKAIKSRSFNSKIVYLLPLLGSNLVSAIMPLRDALGVGIAANNDRFQNSDFAQSTGLKGGTSGPAGKWLDVRIKASEVGTSGNGGIGFWENLIDFTGSSLRCCGATNNSSTATFDLGTMSSQTWVGWGVPGDEALLASTATNGNLYGQRSSITNRELFRNGSSIATSTVSSAVSGNNERNIFVMGWNDAGGTGLYWNGRLGCFYLTDGTLSSAEVSEFDTLLRNYLFTPTGRPAS